MKDLKMDTNLLSKYSRKDQNHEDNLQLKSDILDFLTGKTDRVITKRYRNFNVASHYRRVAYDFLKMLNKLDGIDVRVSDNQVIVERFADGD